MQITGSPCVPSSNFYEGPGNASGRSSDWIGPWYGGVQNVGGEENVPENALSRKCLDPSKRASGLLCRGFLYRKNRALTPEGGGKRTVRGGGPNPLLGGVSFVRFSSPLFFPPPHGVLWLGVPKLTQSNSQCSFREGLLKDKGAFFEAFPTLKVLHLRGEKLLVKHPMFTSPFQLNRISFSTPDLLFLPYMPKSQNRNCSDLKSARNR